MALVTLNLAFSTQAAAAAPLVLRDHRALEQAVLQTALEERQNGHPLAGMTTMLHDVEAMEERILRLEQRILELE